MGIIEGQLVAGMAWDWEVVLTAHDPAVDMLELIIRGPGSVDLRAVPSASGRAFRFRAPKGQTGALPAGLYQWQAILALSDGAERIIDEGRVTITADLRSASAGHEARGFAERMVAMIEAVLENRATLEQRRYQINNRSLERTPVADLMKLRTQFRAQMSAEQARRAGRSPFGRTVYVRF